MTTRMHEMKILRLFRNAVIATIALSFGFLMIAGILETVVFEWI